MINVVLAYITPCTASANCTFVIVTAGLGRSNISNIIGIVLAMTQTDIRVNIRLHLDPVKDHKLTTQVTTLATVISSTLRLTNARLANVIAFSVMVAGYTYWNLNALDNPLISPSSTTSNLTLDNAYIKNLYTSFSQGYI